MTQDSYLRLGQYSYIGTFYQIGQILSRPMISEASPNELFNCVFWLQPEQAVHERTIFGILDLLGDLGGVTEVIIIIFGFFLYPISEH